MSDLSIVIVTWNAKEVLLDCLESIQREVRSRTDEGRIRTETLVVDNGSRDGSVAAVRERHPWAEVIALPENIGFAAGNNVGLRRAKGRHAVLLNSDTIVLPDALESCVRYLDAHPDVGVAGLQLLNPDRSKQNCIHNYPGPAHRDLPEGGSRDSIPGSLSLEALPSPGTDRRRGSAGRLSLRAAGGAGIGGVHCPRTTSSSSRRPTGASRSPARDGASSTFPTLG